MDDSRDQATVLAELLAQLGHDAHTANEGEEALLVAEKVRPDVILLDIGLPGMDGCEVARRLRANPTNGHALLVALSGYGQPSDRERTRAAGFDQHIVKPIDVRVLDRLLGATDDHEERDDRGATRTQTLERPRSS